MTAEKTREDRLRRAAKRQGIILRKSRVRDRRALEYGRFYLIGERVEIPHPEWGRTLDEVEKYLNGGQQ